MAGNGIFVVTFLPGRRGKGPYAAIERNVIGVPDRANRQQPNPNDDWEVEVVGKNRAGTVLFLRLVRCVLSAEEKRQRELQARAEAYERQQQALRKLKEERWKARIQVAQRMWEWLHSPAYEAEVGLSDDAWADLLRTLRQEAEAEAFSPRNPPLDQWKNEDWAWLGRNILWFDATSILEGYRTHPKLRPYLAQWLNISLLAQYVEASSWEEALAERFCFDLVIPVIAEDFIREATGMSKEERWNAYGVRYDRAMSWYSLADIARALDRFWESMAPVQAQVKAWYEHLGLPEDARRDLERLRLEAFMESALLGK